MEKKITFEEFCDPAYRRAEQMKVKTEAVWVAFNEMRGLLNVSGLARRYFGKSQSWFAQKLHGNCVNGTAKEFTTAECDGVARAFRDIASRLNEYAASIEEAKPTE